MESMAFLQQQPTAESAAEKPAKYKVDVYADSTFKNIRTGSDGVEFNIDALPGGGLQKFVRDVNLFGSRRADMVVLHVGTQELEALWEDWSRFPSVIDAHTQLVEWLRDSYQPGTVILVSGILPRIDSKTLAELGCIYTHQLAKQLAPAHNVHLMRWDDAFPKWNEELFSMDGVHPSETGDTVLQQHLTAACVSMVTGAWAAGRALQAECIARALQKAHARHRPAIQKRLQRQRTARRCNVRGGQRRHGPINHQVEPPHAPQPTTRFLTAGHPFAPIAKPSALKDCTIVSTLDGTAVAVPHQWLAPTRTARVSVAGMTRHSRCWHSISPAVAPEPSASVECAWCSAVCDSGEQLLDHFVCDHQDMCAGSTQVNPVSPRISAPLSPHLSAPNPAESPEPRSPWSAICIDVLSATPSFADTDPILIGGGDAVPTPVSGTSTYIRSNESRISHQNRTFPAIKAFKTNPIILPIKSLEGQAITTSVTEGSTIPPENQIKAVIDAVVSQKISDKKMCLKSDSGVFSIGWLYEVMQLHEYKRIQREVAEENRWMDSVEKITVPRPDCETAVNMANVKAYVDIVQSNSPYYIVSELNDQPLETDLVVDEMKRVLCERWLSVNNIHSVLEIVNRECSETKAYAFMLHNMSPDARSALVDNVCAVVNERFQASVNVRLFFVMHVGKSEPGTFVTDSSRSGNHFSFAVHYLHSGRVLYCDTTAWGVPADLQPFIEQISERLGTCAPQVSACHDPIVHARTKRCGPECCSVFPFQTCTSLCGVACLILVSLAMKSKFVCDQFLQVRGGSKASSYAPLHYLMDISRHSTFLRMVVMDWIMSQSVDVGKIRSKRVSRSSRTRSLSSTSSLMFYNDIDAQLNYDHLGSIDFLRRHKLNFERSKKRLRLKFTLENGKDYNKYFSEGTDQQDALRKLQNFIDTEAVDWLTKRFADKSETYVDVCDEGNQGAETPLKTEPALHQPLTESDIVSQFVGSPSASESSELCNFVHSSLDVSDIPQNGPVKYGDCFTPLNYTEAVKLLSHVDATKVSLVPPISPQGGDVYIISTGGNVDKVDDWKCDQYFWAVNNGTKVYPLNDPIVKKYHHKLSKAGTFKRQAWWLLSNPQLVLVHYMGDSSEYVPQPHGNSKKRNSKPYIRTCPSVLKKLKQNCDAPAVAYQKLVSEPCPGPQEAVLKPRNRIQAFNARSQLRAKRRLTLKDHGNMLLMASQLNEFVIQMVSYPEFTCYLGSPAIIKEFSKLLEDPSVTLSCTYDASFSVGEVFLVPLLFRHAVFEDCPLIPLAFMVYQRKSKHLHEDFLRCLSRRIPNLSDAEIQIVVDKESGIADAVKSVFPNMAILHNWNQIKQDFKSWLVKRKASSADINIYLLDLNLLLSSLDDEDYQVKFAQLSAKWTDPVVEYYTSNIASYFEQHTAPWAVKDGHLHGPKCGMTGHTTDSLDTMLKEFTKFKEVPTDKLASCLHQLQKYYMSEITKSYCAIGQFQLQQDFQHLAKTTLTVALPRDVYSPEEIVDKCLEHVEMVSSTSKHYPPAKCVKMDEESVIEPLDASGVVVEEHVVSEPDMKSFVLDGNNTYSISLDPASTPGLSQIRKQLQFTELEQVVEQEVGAGDQEMHETEEEYQIDIQQVGQELVVGGDKRVLEGDHELDSEIVKRLCAGLTTSDQGEQYIIIYPDMQSVIT